MLRVHNLSDGFLDCQTEGLNSARRRSNKGNDGISRRTEWGETNRKLNGRKDRLFRSAEHSTKEKKHGRWKKKKKVKSNRREKKMKFLE
jgi:hypothetical protein